TTEKSSPENKIPKISSIEAAHVAPRFFPDLEKAGLTGFILSMCALLLLAGCSTTELQKEQTSQREELRQLQEKIGQLHTDVQSVQTENESLHSEVDRLKADLAASHESNAQYEKEIERLDSLVKKLDTAREQDRKIIVEEVSQEISRLSKKVSASAAPSSKTKTPPPKERDAPPPKGRAESPSKEHAVTAHKGRVEEGYEHVVAKGDTLTAIAEAYGVSKKAIMDANKLTKPDLKVGQKIFIPKK
ncbi:MAG: LysM peptidoglycan-binding domain-containing protein, partial [Verrucomicrobia bacterium]|nr:LysM peptidoglycan-binding domain-containing protein [Verrucomicrobiota bacterium]